uniref:Large ribosomal subunit protein bL20c n=1 Tax=Colacium vesiculosum TaxID=102910 RepID=I6NIR7_9EUGL|nr:ribosomal protein L20 [Colacium vesiculosum]
MTRVKRGSVANKRHKKIIKLSKGFVGSHSKLFSSANQQTMKALKYAYNDRKKKKNQYRRLWIVRINALARLNKKNYSYERSESKQLKILLNRKIISEDNLRTYFCPVI